MAREFKVCFGRFGFSSEGLSYLICTVSQLLDIRTQRMSM
jgi:hypothetical protein